MYRIWVVGVAAECTAQPAIGSLPSRSAATYAAHVADISEEERRELILVISHKLDVVREKNLSGGPDWDSAHTVLSPPHRKAPEMGWTVISQTFARSRGMTSVRL